MTARRLYAVRTIAGQGWWLPRYGEHRAPNLLAALLLARRLRAPGVTWRIRRDWTKAWRRL